MIDLHVHCRDWTQSHKETIAHALSVAERTGNHNLIVRATDEAEQNKKLMEKLLKKNQPIRKDENYGELLI